MNADEMENFLKNHSYGRLGLCLGNEPYVVPVAYGYEQGVLYFHSAKQGRKIELMNKNNRVCFEVDEWQKGWGSVICYGEVTLSEDIEAKKKCFELLTGQALPEEHLKNIMVYIGVLPIKEITGRCSPDFAPSESR
jgi:hypothetical protein